MTRARTLMQQAKRAVQKPQQMVLHHLEGRLSAISQSQDSSQIQFISLLGRAARWLLSLQETRGVALRTRPED
jgi:hypothetical protein